MMLSRGRKAPRVRSQNNPSAKRAKLSLPISRQLLSPVNEYQATVIKAFGTLERSNISLCVVRAFESFVTFRNAERYVRVLVRYLEFS